MRAAGQTLASMGPVTLGVGLQNETGYPHEATLDFIDSDIDQSTGTLQVRGSIANQDYVFLPGMFVRVRVPVGTIQDALLVPDRALGIDQRGHYLLLVDQNDEVEQRPVQIGALVGDLRVITQGLAAEDWVVVDGIQRAIAGNKVAAQKVALTPPASAPADGPSTTPSEPTPESAATTPATDARDGAAGDAPQSPAQP
jgi:RND family efflux transporter MFP subunit